GYGPRSLSELYRKLTGTRGWLPGTMINGIPNGAPSYSPDPNAVCSGASRPMLRMYASESGCLGSALILRFQTLSDGKTAHGPIRPPDGAGAGVLVGVMVAVGTGVGTLVAVRVLVFVAARVAVRVMVGVALR